MLGRNSKKTSHGRRGTHSHIQDNTRHDTLYTFLILSPVTTMGSSMFVGYGCTSSGLSHRSTVLSVVIFLVRWCSSLRCRLFSFLHSVRFDSCPGRPNDGYAYTEHVSPMVYWTHTPTSRHDTQSHTVAPLPPLFYKPVYVLWLVHELICICFTVHYTG